ncbi:MAG: hypothetical protein ACK5PP_13075 [Acidimicrobiales bacterium]
MRDDAPAGLARAMHQAWVRFASTGDPNGGGLPDWARFDTGTRAVLDFDVSPRLVLDPDREQRLVWDGVW